MAATFAMLARRFAKPLGFNEHILWISIALLPLLAQSSKPCPIVLLPAVQGFDKLEIDASAGFLDHHLEFLEEFVAKEREALKPVEIGEDILEGLVECEQGLVGAEFLRSRFHAATSSSAFAISSVRPGLKCSL